MTSINWPEHAACRGSDPTAFTGGSDQNSRAAKRICARCPVQQECLDWALFNGEPAGIWGGLAADERRELLRIAPEDADIVTSQGKKADLTQHQIDVILHRLDRGAYFTELEADLRIGREVCRRVWRENREARTPPGRLVRNATEEVAS